MILEQTANVMNQWVYSVGVIDFFAPAVHNLITILNIKKKVVCVNLIRSW